MAEQLAVEVDVNKVTHAPMHGQMDKLLYLIWMYSTSAIVYAQPT